MWTINTPTNTYTGLVFQQQTEGEQMAICQHNLE